MRVIIIFFCFAISTVASSQVPGFMGKRFTVFLEANPTPALFVQNSNNELIKDGDKTLTYKVNRFAFNFRPQVTMEYLVHRDVSIGVSYSRISVGSTLATITDPTAIDKTFTLTGNVLRGQAVGIHFKFYQFGNSASIAPIGFYHTLSGYMTQTNTYESKSSSAKQFKNDFVYPVASYSIGRQSMIAKNLLLKTGVEFGWAFVPFNFFKESPDDWNSQEYSGYNVHRSLFGHYMFNINVALGYNFF